MQKFIISLICCLLPALALAEAPEIRDNAPDRHVVVKGDTLWDISAKFFKDPWKWQEIWGMNKDTIKDPHWIYPGDMIVLDRTNGTLRVGSSTGASSSSSSGNIVKLSPRIRAQSSEHGAIPSIPAGDIGPLLSQPLILGKDGFVDAPTLVGTYEQRVILGNGDIAYVEGLPDGKEPQWQVYRPGRTFVDPDSKEVLGQEAIYLGDVNVEKRADVSTVRITKAVQEIKQGDRLHQASAISLNSYVPHAPGGQIAARVISIYGGVSQGGQNTIITLNKGGRDGLENGHVLALYRKGATINKKLTLPDERYGLLFVFRVFNKVAYALVMQSNLPVELLDSAKTP